MKQTIRTIAISLLTSVVTGVVVYLLVLRENRKTGVVDAVRLFDQYNMKKEMEGQAKIKLQTLSRQTDSVGNGLKMAQATKDEEQIKKMGYAYGYVKNALEQEYKQSNQEINTAVWKRLNPVIEEYGKKNGLHLIIGANGMGSVLYDDASCDLTNDLIKYANKKYEEGN